MATLPYIQIEVAKYLADTMHLNTEEHGAYYLIILNYWQREKPIQESRMPAITRLSNERWQVVKDALKEFFKIDAENVWHHDKIDLDLQRVKRKVKQASDAGKASAAKRAAKKQTPKPAQALKDKTDVKTEAPTKPQPKANEEEKEKKKNNNKKKESISSDELEGLLVKDDSFKLLPSVDPQVWEDYLQMRAEKKKPITNLAKKYTMTKLKILEEKGNCPNEVLMQSINSNWTGVFEIKDGANKNGKPSTNNEQTAHDSFARGAFNFSLGE